MPPRFFNLRFSLCLFLSFQFAVAQATALGSDVELRSSYSRIDAIHFAQTIANYGGFIGLLAIQENQENSKFFLSKLNRFGLQLSDTPSIEFGIRGDNQKLKISVGSRTFDFKVSQNRLFYKGTVLDWRYQESAEENYGRLEKILEPSKSRAVFNFLIPSARASDLNLAKAALEVGGAICVVAMFAAILAATPAIVAAVNLAGASVLIFTLAAQLQGDGVEGLTLDSNLLNTVTAHVMDMGYAIKFKANDIVNLVKSKNGEQTKILYNGKVVEVPPKLQALVDSTLKRIKPEDLETAIKNYQAESKTTAHQKSKNVR
jgi:hypothetical protein